MLQSPHFSHICHCLRPLRLAVRSPAPPKGEPRAAAPPGVRFLCRRGCTDLPSGVGGLARPLALPMGELARLKAVTERVPGRNHRIFSKFATANALSGSLFARQLPQRGSQGRLRRRGCDFCAAGGAIFAPPGSHGLTLCAAGGRESHNRRYTCFKSPMTIPLG